MKPRILIIDDTPANLMTLGSALSAQYDLQFATSGQEGLSLARAAVPDLILLWPGHVAGLEMKAPKGKPTPEQEAIGEKFIQMGHQWGVARSPEEAIALMARWGVPTKARVS